MDKSSQATMVPPEIQLALPKYVQIANFIRDQILRGDLAPAQEVPSEREIAEQWGVSRPTATKALAALRAEGLVEARQGSGTFVREPSALNKRARDRYARARATGAVYGPDERAEITDAGLVVAPDDVAASLGLDPGSKAIRRRRIVSDSSGPIEVSISWFSPGLARIAPRLLKKGRIREGTLNYLERATGRRGRVARDWVGARLGTRDELSALGLRDPQAVLVIRHIVLDGSGEPLEFVEATYPPGRWAVEGEYSLPG